MSLAAMSRSIDGLVQLGYVGRRESDTDRRSRLVTLLPQGREALGRVLEARDAVVAAFAAALPDDERTALRDALLPIAERIGSRMTERLRMSDDNRRWWTLAAMCFALFMVMLDNTVVNVALPSIQADFGASLSALEWTINAYTLPFAVLLVTGGRLGDLFGRRRVFLCGVVLFALASATIGLAPSDNWLIASRAVQGVGAALMMPGSLSILTNAFPPAERGKAIGTWAGVSALALAVGPLVGGWLTEEVSWRAIFLLNLPVAAGAVAMTLFAADESRDETAERKLDIPGIGALTVVAGRPGPRARGGQQLGLGLRRRARAPRPRRRVGRRLRGDREAGPRPHRRLRVLPLPLVRGGEHRRLRGLVRDVRDVLLHRALHAEHPRLLAAGGRRALPSLDAGDHGRRPDRGAARGPHRRPAADGRRPADHVGGAVLAVAHRRGVGLRHAVARASSSWASAWA